MLKNQACNTQNKISKNTVLALLNSKKLKGPQLGEVVSYTNKGITKQYRVSKVNQTTVELELGSEIIEVNKNLVQQNNEIFLDKLTNEEWIITSFNSSTRIVCIDVVTDKGITHLSVTLPALKS